jgi:CelD/BcsL family acetyltransferase involved in cellulose biosynthesis
VERLEFDELDAASDVLDAAVDASLVPDKFCSASSWILPAQRAFSEDAAPYVMRFDEGFAPWMLGVTGLGRTVMPLESGWGLAAPLVGPGGAALVRAAVSALVADRASWDAAFLSGLVRGGADFTSIVHLLGRRWRLGLGQPTVRCVASLAGGEEGFLGRRTAHFRKNVRRAERMAEGRLRWERVAPTDPDVALAVYDQILDIEARSWKGQEGHGIHEGPMRRFYAEMVPRLAVRGALRVTFAYADERPIGYVLGGVRGRSYRGLQISFDAAWTPLSVGNLLQLHTVRGLCAERVLAYDLGTEMAYKAAWAEQRVETVPLVIR